MNKKYFLIAIILFSTQFVFSQTNSDCAELISQSMSAYEKKDYNKALAIFKKALNKKCTLTENDYYNAAFIASLAMNKSLAINYLKIAINKGFDNTDHMAKDTDLDFIRKSAEYKNIIKLVEKKSEVLKQEFKKITTKNIVLAIPFTLNGKWGWLDKNTLKPLCAPILDYADFKSLNGLYFIYNSKKYIYTNDLKVTPISDMVQEPGAPMRMEDEPTVAIDTNEVKGFVANAVRVLKFSSKYKNVELIYEYNEQGQLAIATDKLNRKGIILSDGTIYKSFDFKFSDIVSFLGRFKQTYFIATEINTKTYKVFDRNAEIVYDKTINGLSFFSNYELDPIRNYIFIGFPKVFRVFIGEQQNIFDKITLTTLFPKNYDNISFINGPTDDSNREGNYGNYGLSELYFLVSEGATTFYVDEKGVEYKPK